MMDFKRLGMLGLALMLAFAFAQRNAISLDLQAYRVLKVEESGKTIEKLEAALETKPGQLLEYQLEATNTTDKVLSIVELVIPIPSSTAYQALSAVPLRLGNTLVVPQFSYDGGNSYGVPPLKRKVRVVENGKEVEKEIEVKAEEYTNVRWVLPQLAAKQNVMLKLRTVVR